MHEVGTAEGSGYSRFDKSADAGLSIDPRRLVRAAATSPSTGRQPGSSWKMSL